MLFAVMNSKLSEMLLIFDHRDEEKANGQMLAQLLLMV